MLRERGRTGRTDMLPMLATLSGELPAGTKLRRVQFDPSALEVLVVLPGDAVQRLGPALGLRGYAVDATALRQDASRTEYRIRMFLR